MAQALAADMIAKGLTPTDMVLLTQGSVCLSFSSPLCQGGAQTAGPGAYCLPAPTFTYVTQLTEYPRDCGAVAGCPASRTKT